MIITHSITEVYCEHKCDISKRKMRINRQSIFSFVWTLNQFHMSELLSCLLLPKSNAGTLMWLWLVLHSITHYLCVYEWTHRVPSSKRCLQVNREINCSPHTRSLYRIHAVETFSVAEFCSLFFRNLNSHSLSLACLGCLCLRFDSFFSSSFFVLLLFTICFSSFSF